MPFAAALSQHPGAADATAEVVGELLDRGMAQPDLAVLFCSPHHVGSFPEIVATVRTLLEPRRLLAATAVAVIGGREEVEDGPALSLWTAQLGAVPPAVRLTALSTGSGVALQGLPHLTADRPQTVLLVADPFTLPVPDVLDVLAASHEATAVIGGLASGGTAPGSNRLALDGDVFTDGAVGVVLDAHELGPHEMVVSQGCRPVGAPMIVTRSEGNQLLELAGQGALSRLEQVAGQVNPDERALLAGGVHLGIVADEHRVAFERGDFLVRSVLGADRQRGALTVGAVVEVGTTVQFHVRDAASADEDLRALLAGRRADGALVFTCNGRGQHLFGTPHHDADLVSDITTGRAVAGMFCAGEIGPVGRRSFLHGFTACVLLFEERRGGHGPQ
ncbi:MAG TPA: FIST N-terminal domain-containing protein [Acidimicrobiales bacterium]|nr:FIST N-terminal domain-containing protein [Acidimicrobiales bacterium]